MKNIEIDNKLLEINEAILSTYSSEDSNISLMIGDAGVLLYSCYYYKYSNDERNFDLCHRIIENIFEKLQIEILSAIGFCDGFGGLLWVLKYLKQKQLFPLC